MKKIILIAGLILISHLSFPQIKSIKDKSPESSFWSIGFLGGVPIKIVDKVNSRYNSHAGYVWGVNLFINMNKNTSIGAEFNYGRFTSSSENFYNKFFEITFGPKFHLGSNFYGLVQLGNYFMVYKQKYGNGYFFPFSQSESNPGFGFSLGLEKNITLNENVNLNLNEKLSLGLPGMEPVFYGMLSVGITFNENTNPVKAEKQKSYKTHSISLLGGFTFPGATNYIDYKITPNMSFEGTVKTSPKIEMYGNITYNKIQDNYTFGSSYYSITEITAGPRFFIGSQNYSGFLQLGGGAYIYHNRTQDYSQDETFCGVIAGTGAKIKLYKDISLIITGRFHIIINGNPRPGEYFNTSCGIRYEI